MVRSNVARVAPEPTQSCRAWPRLLHPVLVALRRDRLLGQDTAVPRSSIRARADELVQLHKDVSSAYGARDGTMEADEAWRLAAARFQEATKAFYTTFTGLGAPIRAGNRDAIDFAIRFLEADPWCFRSGYVKADLMTALGNAPVTDDERRRLKAVVLKRLKRREPGLIRPTGRLAANVWDDALMAEIQRVITHGSHAERADAEAVVRAVAHERRSIAGQRRD